MDKFVSQIWLISQAQQMAPLVPKMQAITIQAFGCKNKQSWLISKTWHLDYFSYQGMANKQYAHISRIISKTWHLEIFAHFQGRPDLIGHKAIEAIEATLKVRGTPQKVILANFTP